MTDELEELKQRVAELEKAAKPPEPFVPGPRYQFDPTEGMSMPASAMREMMKAVPDAVMRAISDDARRPNPVTGGAPQPTQPVQRGTGWARPIPVEPPPGIKIIDAMMDEQDRIDRAELALRIAKAELGKGK